MTHTTSFRNDDAVRYGISKAIVLTTFTEYMKACPQSFTLCDDERYWCVYDEMLDSLKKSIVLLSSDYVRKLVASLYKAGIIEVRIIEPKDRKVKKLKICAIGRKYLEDLKGD